MGRHKRYPAKKGTRQAFKRKMRPQDPCNPVPMDDGTEGNNLDPLEDSDIVPGGGESFGIQGPYGMVHADALFERVPRKGDAMDDPKESKRERRRKQRAVTGGDGLNPKAHDGAAGGAEAVTADAKMSTREDRMPRQKPGESARDYSKRVDQCLVSKLAEGSKKVSSDNSRGKQRKRAEAKKKARAEKGKKKARVEEEARLRKSQVPVFGDVVDRPPIMSADALKSQAKLKNMAAGQSSGGNGIPNGLPRKLQDYASQVREAYAALKKKRGAML